MSAVDHILLKLISFSTEQAWIYTILIVCFHGNKACFNESIQAIQHIGEMAATMGKLFIIIDRHQVMTTLKGGGIHEYVSDNILELLTIQCHADRRPPLHHDIVPNWSTYSHCFASM